MNIFRRVTTNGSRHRPVRRTEQRHIGRHKDGKTSMGVVRCAPSCDDGVQRRRNRRQGGPRGIAGRGRVECDDGERFTGECSKFPGIGGGPCSAERDYVYPAFAMRHGILYRWILLRQWLREQMHGLQRGEKRRRR